MSANGARASSVASSSEQSLVGASGYKFKKDGKKTKVKLKAVPIMRRQESDMNGVKDGDTSDRSSSPILPEFDDEVMANFPSGKPRDETLETVICRHCKRPVLKRTAREHVAGCLKSKQEKARKKKEAREAAQRAKEKADKDQEEEDDEDENKDGSKGTNGGSARKSAATNGAGADDGNSKKGKKRKADAIEPDEKADKDNTGPKKKKTKKEEQKPKVVKPKGPVDVEKQCGVLLPNGAQCARSLTCKSHSMGAKRAVPLRSLPYDMLLQAYQKKNQARQQKAAIDANAPLLLDDELDGPLAGPVDSDEEREAVMSAISRGLARPQPIATHTLFPTRRKYQLVRMKEMLSNAMSGNRGGGLFSVPPESVVSAVPRSAGNEGFAMPASITPSSATARSGPELKAAVRKATVEVT